MYGDDGLFLGKMRHPALETGTASGLKRADINSQVVIQGQEVAGFIQVQRILCYRFLVVDGDQLPGCAVIDPLKQPGRNRIGSMR